MNDVRSAAVRDLIKVGRRLLSEFRDIDTTLVQDVARGGKGVAGLEDELYKLRSVTDLYTRGERWLRGLDAVEPSDDDELVLRGPHIGMFVRVLRELAVRLDEADRNLGKGWRSRMGEPHGICCGACGYSPELRGHPMVFCPACGAAGKWVAKSWRTAAPEESATGCVVERSPLSTDRVLEVGPNVRGQVDYLPDDVLAGSGPSVRTNRCRRDNWPNEVPASTNGKRAGKSIDVQSGSFSSYQKDAHRTSGFVDNGGTDEHKLMTVVGLAGEVGEYAEIVKKAVFHRHPLDERQVLRELGDILWYLAEACTAHGLPLVRVAEHNIEKLAKRYPEAFSSERSQNRPPEEE